MLVKSVLVLAAAAALLLAVPARAETVDDAVARTTANVKDPQERDKLIATVRADAAMRERLARNYIGGTQEQINAAATAKAKAEGMQRMRDAWRRGGAVQINRVPAPAAGERVDTSGYSEARKRAIQSHEIERAKNRCRSRFTPSNERCKDI